MEETAIMITIPKTIKWSDYLKELETVADGSHEMNYKVAWKPGKVKPGDKCFVCYDGYVRGWMTISNISKKSFNCSTTGKNWNEGWYISRTGKFHPVEEGKFPQKGFMGIKYVNANDYINN